MTLFRSIAKVQKLMWDWSEESEPSTTTQDLVEEMTRLPKEDLLDGDYITPDPNEKLTRQVLDAMTPDNMIVQFVDPNWDSRKSKSAEYPIRILPHYDAEYIVRPLSAVMPEYISKFRSWLVE